MNYKIYFTYIVIISRFLEFTAVTVTTWEKRKEDIPVVYTDCDMTVDEMVEEQMTAEPTVFTNGVFPASEENVEQYVNPENLVSGYEKYQFMDFPRCNGNRAFCRIIAVLRFCVNVGCSDTARRVRKMLNSM